MINSRYRDFHPQLHKLGFRRVEVHPTGVAVRYSRTEGHLCVLVSLVNTGAHECTHLRSGHADTRASVFRTVEGLRACIEHEMDLARKNKEQRKPYTLDGRAYYDGDRGVAVMVQKEVGRG